MKSTVQEPGVTNLTNEFRNYKIKVPEKQIPRSNGTSDERIKKGSGYLDLKNSQKELDIASMMSKVLRQSLSEGMSKICESYVSSRLTTQFKNLAKMEEGEKGMRPLNLSKHGHLLKGFEFNTKAPYKKIFDARYFVKAGSRRGQVILHFPSFIPEKAFHKPEGATNFKINVRLIALSDFYFDKPTDQYRPECEELHGTYGSFESQMLPLLKMPIDPMTAQVSLTSSKPLPESVGLFLVMAVSFFHYQSGRFNHLSEISGMQIHKVY